MHQWLHVLGGNRSSPGFACRQNRTVLMVASPVAQLRKGLVTARIASGAVTATWRSGELETVTALLDERLEKDPDAEYLDVCGTKFSAADVDDNACRIANGLRGLGLQPGDRVATLVENSPEALLAWFGAVRGGFVAVPVNTAYKGQYLRH